MAGRSGPWGRGVGVSVRGPKPGVQGESMGFGEGGRELLGHGVRSGVHGACGGGRGGRPLELIGGLTEGLPEAWELGGFLWQGVARPGYCRAGWRLAQGRGLLGWSPARWSRRVVRSAVLQFILALLRWSGRSLAIGLLRSLGFPPPSKWALPLSHL